MLIVYNVFFELTYKTKSKGILIAKLLQIFTMEDFSHHPLLPEYELTITV